MRIVAGKFGSRTLKTLSGDTTRPTSDKIRGAIFNKIGPYFDGGRFLDVFGGSGAMAFEALSRGMESATIFEKDRKAAVVIRENIQTLGIAKHINFKLGDSQKLVEGLSGTYDVIFLDPPYAYKDTEILVAKIIELGLAHDDTWILVETDSKRDISNEIKGFEKIDKKDYKATTVHYFIKKI